MTDCSHYLLLLLFSRVFYSWLQVLSSLLIYYSLRVEQTVGRWEGGAETWGGGRWGDVDAETRVEGRATKIWPSAAGTPSPAASRLRQKISLTTGLTDATNTVYARAACQTIQLMLPSWLFTSALTLYNNWISSWPDYQGDCCMPAYYDTLPMYAIDCYDLYDLCTVSAHYNC